MDPQSTGLEFTEARCSSDSRQVRGHPAFLYLIAALADENLAGSDELVIDSPPDLSPEVYTPSYVWREARYCTEYLAKYNFVMGDADTLLLFMPLSLKVAAKISPIQRRGPNENGR